MTQLRTFQSDSFKVQCLSVDGSPWLKGKDVADILGYTNSRKAIGDHVEDDDKKTIEEVSKGNDSLRLPANSKNTVFINESGLYSLILRSDKPQAKTFKKWVTSEVLPAIRKTGAYVAPPPPPPPAPLQDVEYRKNRSFNMQSENDLHSKVVDYLRRFYPHAKILAGLGEFQTTDALRIEGWRKGYQRGTADLMIVNNHLEHRGFCLEFKNPRGSGTLSESQDTWLQDLHLNGYKVLVSNDYDLMVREVSNYFLKVRLACPHCLSKPVYFKTQNTMQQHIVAFHRKKYKNNLFKGILCII